MMCHPETAIPIEQARRLHTAWQAVYFCEKCAREAVYEITLRLEVLQCKHCGLSSKDNQPSYKYFNKIKIEEVFYLKDSTYIKLPDSKKTLPDEYGSNWSTKEYNALNIYTQELEFFHFDAVFFIKKKG